VNAARRPAVAAVASTLLLAGCFGGSGGSKHDAARAKARPIAIAPVPCGTFSGRGCVPDAKRVDLRPPVFSHPTSVTNPLFPIGNLRSVVFLGHVDGKPFRTETTLLPGTEPVVWGGQRIDALVSQYMAYSGGRLEEVALDRYAQADDGSVWYLGEDVFDYRKGSVALTEGTWRAGRDGPGAMIMPAHPRPGAAHRTENVPGVVFEEVTISGVDRTVAGPAGPVHGAIVASELHMDGTREDKVFAPGYGEFRTAGGGDLEALALAVPANALRGPEPTALPAALTAAEGLLEAARVRDWKVVALTRARLQAAWDRLATGSQPPMIAARVRTILDTLRRAVRRRDVHATEHAALDAAMAILDIRLRYVPPPAVNVERLHLWTQRLRVDADVRDAAAVAGDIATIEWIRDRIAHSLGGPGSAELDHRLAALRVASDAGNLPSAADQAARLGARVRVLASGRTGTP
jgi:hypothetical protein